MAILKTKYKWTLRRKLVLTSLLCLLLPSIVTLIASDYLTQRIVRTQAIENEKKSLELTDVFLSSLFDNMIRVSNGIMLNNDINLALKEMWQRQRIGQVNIAQDTLDGKKIGGTLESIASTMDTVYVTVLTNEGQQFSNYSFDLYGSGGNGSLLDMPWMDQVKSLSVFEVGWVGLVKQYSASGGAAEPYVLTMARNLRLPSKDSYSYAYVIVSISQRQLGSIFQHDVGRQETMLINQEGQILVSKDNNKIGTTFNFAEQVLKASGTQSVTQNNEEYLLSVHNLSYNGYKIVSLRPYKEAVNQIQTVYRFSFIIQIGAVLLFLLVSIYMIRQFTKPVIRLGEVAAKVENGDLSVRSGIRGGDEIGYLGRLFDQMLNSIEWMVGQIRAEQALKRKAELAMLQAQINPHFLFNILNSIRLRILMKGDKENAHLLSSLSGLLRMTIQRQSEFIPLHEELDIVRKYMDLLNFRQTEPVELIIEAASDSLPSLVPRFFLQPMIENAYLHGLEQRAGRIQITVQRTQDRLTILIADNGKGMSPETLSKLRDEMKSLRGPLPEDISGRLSGIGITNVYERLYLIYGNEFGLLLDSSPGEGTRIELSFLVTPPAMKKGES